MAQREIQRSQAVVPCVKLRNVTIGPKYKCGCPSCPEKFDYLMEKFLHEETEHDPRDIACIMCGLVDPDCSCDLDGFMREEWKV